jgi:hypothetical protein
VLLATAWATFLGRVPWEWFITLTFDPKRRFPISRDLASREAFWWCGLVGQVYRIPVAWVYAIERTSTGSHHVHVLFVGLHHNPRWTPVVEPWRERNGSVVDVRRVNDIDGVALYTTKSVAAHGEVVWSDTLSRYRKSLARVVTVPLVPAR